MKHRTNERRLSFKVNKVLHFWKSLLLCPVLKAGIIYFSRLLFLIIIFDMHQEWIAKQIF